MRVVVRGVREAPTFADKYLWIKTFPPLLKLVGEAPLSKEVSKEVSKGKPATRSRATGVALPDGYLIRSVAGGCRAISVIVVSFTHMDIYLLLLRPSHSMREYSALRPSHRHKLPQNTFAQ